MSKAATLDTVDESESCSFDALYYLAKAQSAVEEENHLLVVENLIKAHIIEPSEIDILAALADTQFRLEHWKESLSNAQV